MKKVMWVVVFLLLGSGFNWTESQAGPYRSIVRTISKIADDVPLKTVDDVANPETRKMAKELVTKGKMLDNMSYTRQLGKQVENVLGSVPDPALLRSVNALDDAGKETILLLSRGSKNVSGAIPDIARRADFLKNVDTDTLCVLGRYDGLVDQAVTMKTYLNAGQIVSPKGFRKITMEDFGNFFKKTGEKGVAWWNKNVRPHWKLWAVGGTLATILILPEEYTDYFIEIAADGTAKVSHAARKALVETGNAAGNGTLEILKGFFSTFWGSVVFIVGSIILLLWILSLTAVQKTISWIIKIIFSVYRWIAPKKKKDIGQDIG